jgi:hypothetical protein
MSMLELGRLPRNFAFMDAEPTKERIRPFRRLAEAKESCTRCVLYEAGGVSATPPVGVSMADLKAAAAAGDKAR